MKRISLVLFVVAAGCSHPKTVHQPAPVSEAPAAKPAPVPPTPASTNVAVGNDIAKQCSLKLGNPQAAPKFDFDTSELEANDRDVLEQIATCVTTGPLKGQKLELTGRADPRGTEEYNLGLGTRRAASVKTYLEHLGVSNNQLGQTTRGSLDATGNDDTSWSTDRRVDITLSSRS